MELLRTNQPWGGFQGGERSQSGPGDTSPGWVPELTEAEREAVERARDMRKQKAAQVDEQLLERIAQDRSEEAFSELYDRFSSRVYALLIHMLRVEEDAQDLLQEIFIIVWHKAPSFLEQRGNVAAWIMSIARNRAVDEIRSKRYRDRKTESTLEMTGDRPEIDLLVDSDHTADGELNAKEAQTEVRRALRTLTDDQRSVIDLAYFGGMTHSEISAQLDMPMGTVKSKLRQGLMRMAKVIAPRM